MATQTARNLLLRALIVRGESMFLICGEVYHRFIQQATICQRLSYQKPFDLVSCCLGCFQEQTVARKGFQAEVKPPCIKQSLLTVSQA